MQTNPCCGASGGGGGSSNPPALCQALCLLWYVPCALLYGFLALLLVIRPLVVPPPPPLDRHVSEVTPHWPVQGRVLRVPAAGRAAASDLGRRGCTTSIPVFPYLLYLAPPGFIACGGWERAPLGGCPPPVSTLCHRDLPLHASFQVPPPLSPVACRRRALLCPSPLPIFSSCSASAVTSASVGHLSMAPSAFVAAAPPHLAGLVCHFNVRGGQTTVMLTRGV